ncbi:MAG: 5-bromo-4-chloroindolyl phosphate hydrolysis family protein [Oscillospiraceae bacterium]|nr:5-bromo-4-chloroindolyl phosphate hydrolysis family protein [Oscillospiraceae bacterium]
MSGKIDRIEQVVRRIFDRVKTHPEVIPDLKKLMDYYLPMTVKLLTAYADMDAQPVQGEHIQSSKREIEATLDTLTAAYEKLLDELFQETALDISSDISVLNAMLAREGLTEDELTKMRKQQNLS